MQNSCAHSAHDKIFIFNPIPQHFWFLKKRVWCPIDCIWAWVLAQKTENRAIFKQRRICKFQNSSFYLHKLFVTPLAGMPRRFLFFTALPAKRTSNANTADNQTWKPESKPVRKKLSVTDAHTRLTSQFATSISVTNHTVAAVVPFFSFEKKLAKPTSTSTIDLCSRHTPGQSPKYIYIFLWSPSGPSSASRSRHAKKTNIINHLVTSVNEFEIWYLLCCVGAECRQSWWETLVITQYTALY